MLRFREFFSQCLCQSVTFCTNIPPSPIQSILRGTNPDESYPENVAAGLQSDGLKISEQKPQKLSQIDVSKAVRIVAFCQLPAEFAREFTVENWSNVPPVSENYDKSRDEILKRIKRILADVQ